MTATARRISQANLHERLALTGPRDELKELGDTIDGLLARLAGGLRSPAPIRPERRARAAHADHDDAHVARRRDRKAWWGARRRWRASRASSAKGSTTPTGSSRASWRLPVPSPVELPDRAALALRQRRCRGPRARSPRWKSIGFTVERALRTPRSSGSDPGGTDCRQPDRQRDPPQRTDGWLRVVTRDRRERVRLTSRTADPPRSGARELGQPFPALRRRSHGVGPRRGLGFDRCRDRCRARRGPVARRAREAGLRVTSSSPGARTIRGGAVRVLVAEDVAPSRRRHRRRPPRPGHGRRRRLRRSRRRHQIASTPTTCRARPRPPGVHGDTICRLIAERSRR